MTHLAPLACALALGACSLPHVTACAPKPSDLCFYQTDAGSPLAAGEPKAGERVMLYGNSVTGGPRQAEGVIVDPDILLTDRGVRGMFIKSEAGYGFSGSPVTSPEGKWLGIVTDKMRGTGGSINGMDGLFAYRAKDVLKQFGERR